MGTGAPGNGGAGCHPGSEGTGFSSLQAADVEEGVYGKVCGGSWQPGALAGGDPRSTLCTRGMCRSWEPCPHPGWVPCHPLRWWGVVRHAPCPLGGVLHWPQDPPCTGERDITEQTHSTVIPRAGGPREKEALPALAAGPAPQAHQGQGPVPSTPGPLWPHAGCAALGSPSCEPAGEADVRQGSPQEGGQGSCQVSLTGGEGDLPLRTAHCRGRPSDTRAASCTPSPGRVLAVWPGEKLFRA